jgi:hypothetical protein
MAERDTTRTMPSPTPPYPTIQKFAPVVGACALMPLPFVDALLRRAALKAAYRRLLTDAGLDAASPTLRSLLRERTNLALGCLVAIVWWPIKKLFRTIIFVLLVKDALDWTSDAGVRLRMVHRAIERGLLPDRAEAVGAAIDACARAHLGSPVWRGLRRVKNPPMDWERSPNPVSALTREMATLGGGHAALAAFDDALDRLERGE